MWRGWLRRYRSGPERLETGSGGCLWALAGAEAQFEEDRRGDDEAIGHGWRPLRFTWKMLHHEVEWVWAKVSEGPPTRRS